MSVCVIFLKINCSLPYKRRFSKTLKLAKTAFILSTGQSKKTTHWHNFLWGMYTLIAVYVHFNRFIDLTIYSDTNPYNLASDRLLWRRVTKQVFRKVHEKPIMELNNGDGNKIVQKAVSFYAKQQRKSTSHLCWRHSTTTTWNFGIFYFMDDELL